MEPTSQYVLEYNIAVLGILRVIPDRKTQDRALGGEGDLPGESVGRNRGIDSTQMLTHTGHVTMAVTVPFQALPRSSRRDSVPGTTSSLR